MLYGVVWYCVVGWAGLGHSSSRSLTIFAASKLCYAGLGVIMTEVEECGAGLG